MEASEPMSLTIFGTAYLTTCYGEIKLQDWKKLVMRLVTSNKSALFQHSSVFLPKNLLDISSGVFVDTALQEKNCTVKAENTRLLQNGNYHFTFNLPLVVWFGCISLA